MALPTRKRQTKKPSSLPQDFSRTVRELLQKQFKRKIGDAEFLVYVDLYPNEAILCVSLSHPKSLRAGTLYISADLTEDLKESPDKVTDQLKNLVDVAASWFSQVFSESEGLDAALEAIDEASGNWEAFPWEGQTLYAKLNRDNHTLEHAADKLLRDAGIDPEEDEITEEDLEALLDADEEKPKIH